MLLARNLFGLKIKLLIFFFLYSTCSKYKVIHELGLNVPEFTLSAGL